MKAQKGNRKGTEAMVLQARNDTCLKNPDSLVTTFWSGHPRLVGGSNNRNKSCKPEVRPLLLEGNKEICLWDNV
jgi:hypothetical protein